MEYFPYRGEQLFAEELPVQEIAAQYGTPCYIYSRAALEAAFTAYTDALRGAPHLVCYAVKANSNIAVLNILARLGAGFDHPVWLSLPESEYLKVLVLERAD